MSEAFIEQQHVRLEALRGGQFLGGKGSYGLSDKSGKPISKARLEAAPEAIPATDEERGREACG